MGGKAVNGVDRLARGNHALQLGCRHLLCRRTGDEDRTQRRDADVRCTWRLEKSWRRGQYSLGRGQGGSTEGGEEVEGEGQRARKHTVRLFRPGYDQ